MYNRKKYNATIYNHFITHTHVYGRISRDMSHIECDIFCIYIFLFSQTNNSNAVLHISLSKEYYIDEQTKNRTHINSVYLWRVGERE